MNRFLLCLALLGLILCQAAGQQCNFPPNDRTDPKCLTGAIDREEYTFKWATDAEQEVKDVWTYIRQIKNFHAESMLPVKWEKAQIMFGYIKPGMCGVNEFQSTKKHKKEQAAPIKYGARLEHTVDASLYSPTDEKAKMTQELKSTMRVNEVAVLIQSIRPEQDKIRYEITNAGVSSVSIVMKDLFDDIGKLQDSKDIEMRPALVAEPRSRAINLDNKSVIKIDISLGTKDLEIVEAQHRIEMFLGPYPKSGTAVATGLVSVHVPRKKNGSEQSR